MKTFNYVKPMSDDHTISRKADSDNTDQKEQLQRKNIKSFVLRTGRMTAAQKRGWDESWERWGLVNQSDIDLEKVFGRKAPVVLEIGFGMGQSLIKMAENEPEKNFLGIEVHKPGVGALLNNAQKAGVNNIRVFCDDAVTVLNECIDNRSLDRIQIYFPDPWHKKKHKKRRLIQPGFVKLLHQKLDKQGVLHLATDWEDYAIHMMDTLSSAAGWKNLSGHSKFSPDTGVRPETKFERRGKRLGHSVYDLIFSKV